MPLSTPMNKKEIKRGEETLKGIIGGKILHNSEFVRLLKVNGIGDTSKAWGIINHQIKLELEDGRITYEDVGRRVNQLVLEMSPNNRLITLDEADAAKVEDAKRDILSKGKINIQIPYQSSGVGDVAIGTAIWGRSGAILGALNEGETKWKYTNLLFMNDGFTIKSTGDVVLYDDIRRMVFGNRGFVHTIVTFVLNNDSKFICKVANIDLAAFNSIVSDHIEAPKRKSEDIQTINDNADILLKYADLYERGLITREEYDEKKEQLLHGADVENPDEESDIPASFCTNCGAPVDADSNFCSSCGAKIL
ncbi:zinc-ribbon domain-containing protein [uncultured Methanobrevibacter sp.]|uniref:zinc-ribbon domain-containing protein n=1 Tax=uncultured Methanobrevibacter sp. TaxID=253161 RepID=UPI0026202AF7|nr:zinc-ribbon domain-containing protein [uncultured Methanobrevibacter sp.]